ncbi:DUF4214 domain-containing protein [Candidatus Saccharibacteria bacterium]|nr:DUF4214 domain-containing protein [Candidatus Saccharibacteria bacterium]
MNIDLKKINPFNKNKDQKRASDGKFTAGSGGLSAVKKFNWKRSTPVIVITALVGGFFVFQSFAGQTLYSYQYSAYQCPSFNKESTENNSTDLCVGKSAEALTYRYYEATFARKPDNNGLKYWTQKLAGDRTKPSRVAAIMIESNEANYGQMSDEDFVAKLYQSVLGRNGDTGGIAYWKGQLTSKKKTRDEAVAYFAKVKGITTAQAQAKMGRPDNKQFVEEMYIGLFGRDVDSKGLVYWKGQLDTKKRSRGDVMAYLATEKTNIAIEKHGQAFATFLKDDAPKVSVVQTARIKQEADTKYAKEQINGKTAYVVSGMKSRSALNNDLKVAAGKISDKPQSQITQSSLDTIRNDYSAVIATRLTNFKGKDWQGKVNGNYNRAKALYDHAVEVNKYSPDITYIGLTNELRVAKSYKDDAQKQVDNAQWLLNETNRALTIATNKYNAERARLAELARQQAAAAARAEEKRQCIAAGKSWSESSGCSDSTDTDDTVDTTDGELTCPGGTSFKDAAAGKCYTTHSKDPTCKGVAMPNAVANLCIVSNGPPVQTSSLKCDNGAYTVLRRNDSDGKYRCRATVNPA